MGRNLSYRRIANIQRKGGNRTALREQKPGIATVKQTCCPRRCFFVTGRQGGGRWAGSPGAIGRPGTCSLPLSPHLQFDPFPVSHCWWDTVSHQKTLSNTTNIVGLFLSKSMSNKKKKTMNSDIWVLLSRKSKRSLETKEMKSAHRPATGGGRGRAGAAQRHSPCVSPHGRFSAQH